MAETSTAFEDYKAETYWRSPARNFKSSARLHLQHYLCQNVLGHLLDPRVEQGLDTSETFSVADIGCGTGSWLLALERDLSNKGAIARLDGFDVNPFNFPAPQFLPQSVTLTKLDVLAQLPEELIGTYDVVHIRGFVSLIVNSNVTPLLTAASALLKPGGLIQWEETLADRFRIDTPSPDISKTTCDTIAYMLKAGGDARGFNYGFVEHLDQHLTSHGFQDVTMESREKPKRDLKAWTDNYLMIWDELYINFPLKTAEPSAPMTRETWLDMYAKAVEETEHGVVIHHGSIMTAIGRKF
ncbi:hypothetical protein GGR57DRAFT_506355 [Xylariaceae sp. FL1272]|nr:hypothetical protein GGR57DRAFT_506355 [Xylariaceae sp. FL1272]